MENKTEILERLIKEGHISFAEALILNETEKELVAQPYPVYPQQSIYPMYPSPVIPYHWGIITCVDKTSTATVNPMWNLSGGVTLTDNNPFA